MQIFQNQSAIFCKVHIKVTWHGLHRVTLLRETSNSTKSLASTPH